MHLHSVVIYLNKTIFFCALQTASSAKSKVKSYGY